MRIDSLVAQLNAKIRLGKSPRAALFSLLRGTTPVLFPALLAELQRSPAFRQATIGVPTPSSYAQLGDLSSALPPLPDAVAFCWAAAILKRHSKEITKFLASESRIEHALSAQSWVQALAILDDLEAELGVSIWALSYRFTLPDKQRNSTREPRLSRELSWALCMLPSRVKV